MPAGLSRGTGFPTRVTRMLLFFSLVSCPEVCCRPVVDLVLLFVETFWSFVRNTLKAFVIFSFSDILFMTEESILTECSYIFSMISKQKKNSITDRRMTEEEPRLFISKHPPCSHLCQCCSVAFVSPRASRSSCLFARGLALREPLENFCLAHQIEFETHKDEPFSQFCGSAKTKRRASRIALTTAAPTPFQCDSAASARIRKTSFEKALAARRRSKSFWSRDWGDFDRRFMFVIANAIRRSDDHPRLEREPEYW